ncbi:MAG: terpene cyclase/mutase family protein [Verrucomicrobia bacterium]|nr:terpene cyclase/mutase family protein [Verrucomicrobiota bacterium]
MSLRLEMLQVARLAPRLLGDSASLVRDFLLRQQNADGGFKDRSGRSDLYYTVFGMDAWLAVEVQTSSSRREEAPFPICNSQSATCNQSEPPHVGCYRVSESPLKVQSPPAFKPIEPFLRAFDDGAGLDFVHLCCLARAWAQCRTGVAPVSNFISHLESFRSSDGGYHQAAGSQSGSAYGCFLALGAYQDLKAALPDPAGVLRCLHSLETPDGAWTNSIRPPASGVRAPQPGSTNATAAAITILRNLGQPVPARAADWLLARLHPHGGFLAAPDAPLPDLLSTATALHALSGMQVPLDGLQEKCLDFIDSLWTNEGSFHGHWAEDVLDAEYTFYGLLALGHLSL